MHTETESRIRRRTDGSIDTTYYMALGRFRRAEQARFLAGKIRPARPFRHIAQLVIVTFVAQIKRMARPFHR